MYDCKRSLLLPARGEKFTRWVALSVLVLLIIVKPALGQTLTIDSLHQPTALAGLWKFQTGDDPRWAHVDFDDSDWDLISPQESWTRQGYAGYSGMGWYRLRLVFDLQQVQRESIELGSHLALLTGNVQSAYELYADGHLLTTVGQLPPSPVIHYGQRAVVSIPAALLVNDGELVLALRVWRSPLMTDDWQAGMSGDAWLVGDEIQLLLDQERGKVIPVALALLYLVIGIYHLFMYALNRHYSEYFWFGLACLAIAIHTTSASQFAFDLGLPFRAIKTLEYTATFVSAPLWLAVIFPVLGIPKPRWVNWYSWPMLALPLPLLVVSNFAAHIYTMAFWQLWVLPGILAGFFTIGRQALRASPEARIITMGVMIPAIAAIHDILVDREIIEGAEVSYLAFSAFVFAMAMSLASRMTRLRGNLEGAVRERTRELESSNARLEKAIRIDGLTGIANRRAFIEQAQRERDRFARAGRPFAILLVDIDHFKKSNDSYGHACGDLVLVETARILTEQVRKQDTVARWGGEEFIVLLPETDGEGAEVIAEKLRIAIANASIVFRHEDGLFTIATTITVGGAVYQTVASLDECIRRADIALYRGKAAGRNQVVLHKISEG